VNSSSPHLLIIGYGRISQCALPLIIDFFLFKQHIRSLTIIDTNDQQSKLQQYLTLNKYQTSINRIEFEQTLKNKNYPKLAYLLGIKRFIFLKEIHN
jgi:homospermidine synthase